MTKKLETPTSRLVCFGSAKLNTNSPLGGIKDEVDPELTYNP